MNQPSLPEIVVSLQAPTQNGRLYYERDLEIEGNDLVIESSERCKLIYGINLNGGNALVSFDKEHILRDVEFVYPWRAWRNVAALEIPSAVRQADIILVGVKSASGNWITPVTRLGSDSIIRYHYEFEPDVIATTNTARSSVQFMFSKFESAGEWIALSDRCFAFIQDSFLRGFFVRLANAPLKRHGAE